MSWYKEPKRLTDREAAYLDILERVFYVKNPLKEWIPYKLTPHQVEYHKYDLACSMYKSVDKVVVKSRQTSFTVSSLISLIMAGRTWENHTMPIMRLRHESAKELIKEAKDIIRHVAPDNGLIDPTKFTFTATKIIFPNGAEMVAFPANDDSADAVRGLRVLTGLIDEANFMKYFNDIFIAFQDADSGSDEKGRKLFQMIIGTTLRGLTTPFYQWYDGMRKAPSQFGFRLFRWPAFDPKVVKLNKPLTEQKNLIPIVPWKTIKDMEKKRFRNLETFKEEQMCMPVDSEDSYIKMKYILAAVEGNLENHKVYRTENPLYMGIDVATKHDYFYLTIFEKTEFGFVQRHAYYTRKVELPILQRLVELYLDDWNIFKCRIDASGLGEQIAQYLRGKYGSKIEPIKFASRVKGLEKSQSTPIKEKMAGNLLMLLQDGQIKLLNDDLQIRHLNAVNRELKSASNEYGHADGFWSIALAVLPINYRSARHKPLASNLLKKSIEKAKELKAPEVIEYE